MTILEKAQSELDQAIKDYNDAVTDLENHPSPVMKMRLECKWEKVNALLAKEESERAQILTEAGI